MDGQESFLEGRGASVNPADNNEDFPMPDEVIDLSEISPLNDSIAQWLKIQDSNSNSPLTENKMGNENNWTETNSMADFPIPLPLPYESLSDPNNSAKNGTEHGPFLPSSESNRKNLYSEVNSSHDESIGVCGLRNLGNTCFMAAGLQCLTATLPVQQHFIKLQNSRDTLPPSGTLMANFSMLLSKMWSGKYNVLLPIEFKHTLGVYHSQFKDYRQHDCQEFLALLLDSLHEQMNIAKTSKSSNLPTDTATITASETNSHCNGNIDSTLGSATFTAMSNLNTFDLSNPMNSFMNSLDSPSPEDGPSSPNLTVAGSPRGIDDFLDSTANSTRSSPINDDEDTLDSEELIISRSNFIHNDMNGFINREMRYDDIAKDAKTSNTNFLVQPPKCNNEICYDSQKFPKENKARRTLVLENTNYVENHDFDNKCSSVKRIKEINCNRSSLERINALISNGSDIGCDDGLEKCNVKRMRLEDQEKNHRIDAQLGASAMILQCHENGTIASQDEVEADKHWAKHLRDNHSIIVDTFQGQFKSTVICEECKHVSITYEPFMYLSVPLPNAMERQLFVTFVQAGGCIPIRCVLALNKQSRVCQAKEELIKTLDLKNINTTSITFAEVLENHIARILEDSLMLRYINDANRSIYAFELRDPPEAWIDCKTSPTNDDLSNTASSSSVSPNSNNNTGSEDICIICLEECDGELNRHCDNGCKLVICDPCIKIQFNNEGEPKICPDCKKPSPQLVKISQSSQSRPTKILNVPLVIRHDTEEATNNRKGTKLFDHPRLLKLPSRLDAKVIHNIVGGIVPKDVPYTIRYVEGKGDLCSRCMFTSHCTGCKIPDEGQVTLRTGDSLAVRYVDKIPEIQQPIDHVSVSSLRPHHPLSLYDCIQAFSQSEVLDEHNPWYCPKCKKNQCATKTLTVHRYPKFLIVYLKRFVFYECISMKLDDKVTFPLVGLSCGKHLYDLYACVCHFGGVSAGHYTAYAKNPQTDVWYYYNDEATSRQKPQEEDFSNAYILFYSQQEPNVKLCNI